MRVRSFVKNQAKIVLTSPEDCWYLMQIIEPGDLLSGRTFRKVSIGSEEGKRTHTQKSVVLQIRVERIDIAGSSLRISGKITQGPDDVPLGSYHTVTLEEGTEWLLEKEEWLAFHRTQLRDATEAMEISLLVCCFDRDEAIIAQVKQHNIDILVRLKGEQQKKEKRALAKGGWYETLIQSITTYAERLKISHIIVASPAFYKEELVEQITDKDLKKRIILATCSSARENALDEVLRRPETRSALRHSRIAQETKIVEEVLTSIAKQGAVAYGHEQVSGAATAGAVNHLLVTDVLIREYRENKKFKEMNDLMKSVDRTGGEIHIINTEHDAGKKLQGLGGIAALLRYKREW